jgi:hypothetical protein
MKSYSSNESQLPVMMVLSVTFYLRGVATVETLAISWTVHNVLTCDIDKQALFFTSCCEKAGCHSFVVIVAVPTAIQTRCKIMNSSYNFLFINESTGSYVCKYKDIIK